jgi:hypothetical protein
MVAHGIGGEWLEQVEKIIRLAKARIEPEVVVLRLHNDRHSVVNGRQKRI